MEFHKQPKFTIWKDFLKLLNKLKCEYINRIKMSLIDMFQR